MTNGQKIAAAAYVGVASLLLASGVAIAQTPALVVEAGLPRASVSYADLDLGSEAGRAALNARVKSAASRLCLQSGRQPLAEWVERKRCFAHAIASAEPQVAAAIADGPDYAARRTVKVALRD